MALLDYHKTEISALNTLIQLMNTSGGTTGLATESTQNNIEESVDELEILTQALIDQNEGSINTSVTSPALPYTVPADTYQSFSIMTQGSVAVGGVTVPEGFIVSNSFPSSEGFVNSPTFTNVSGGSIIVTLGIKV